MVKLYNKEYLQNITEVLHEEQKNTNPYLLFFDNSNNNNDDVEKQTGLNEIQKQYIDYLVNTGSYDELYFYLKSNGINEINLDEYNEKVKEDLLDDNSKSLYQYIYYILCDNKEYEYDLRMAQEQQAQKDKNNFIKNKIINIYLNCDIVQHKNYYMLDSEHYTNKNIYKINTTTRTQKYIDKNGKISTSIIYNQHTTNELLDSYIEEQKTRKSLLINKYMLFISKYIYTDVFDELIEELNKNELTVKSIEKYFEEYGYSVKWYINWDDNIKPQYNITQSYITIEERCESILKQQQQNNNTDDNKTNNININYNPNLEDNNLFNDAIDNNTNNNKIIQFNNNKKINELNTKSFYIKCLNYQYKITCSNSEEYKITKTNNKYTITGSNGEEYIITGPNGEECEITNTNEEYIITGPNGEEYDTNTDIYYFYNNHIYPVYKIVQYYYNKNDNNGLYMCVYLGIKNNISTMKDHENKTQYVYNDEQQKEYQRVSNFYHIKVNQNFDLYEKYGLMEYLQNTKKKHHDLDLTIVYTDIEIVKNGVVYKVIPTIKTRTIENIPFKNKYNLHSKKQQDDLDFIIEYYRNEVLQGGTNKNRKIRKLIFDFKYLDLTSNHHNLKKQKQLKKQYKRIEKSIMYNDLFFNLVK